MQQSDGSDALKAKWRDLVGGFILAFGDIEFSTFFLWEHYFGSEKASNNFKERTSKILGKLRSDSQASQTVIESLVEALKISDKRNTVAHHPLQVQVFRHSATGKLITQLGISSETTDDFVSDEELTQLRARTEELRTRLYRALWPAKHGAQ
jgi:hypothetical protein